MIPLFKPYMPELPDIDKILHSGDLAYGKYCKMFETELKEYFQSNYILTVNTFQSAIDIALNVLGLKPGDEVITSPLACLASTQPLISYGLKIIWADVDNHRGTLDPQSVKHHITNNTKCIIHNHFCGYPGYINEINKIGAEFGIPIIDDGIECFGSEYHNVKIGSLDSDITIFSLSPVRIPNTIDGGIIIFKDNDHMQKGILARDYGIDRTNFRDQLGEINSACDIVSIGYGAMPTNLSGYIGYNQMKYVNQLLEKQRKNSLIWDEYFEKSIVKSLNIDKQNKPNYWVYGAYVNDKWDFINDYRNKGFYASGVHINNNRYSVFKNNEVLPGTEDFYNHFVALPCGWWMGD